MSLCTDCPRRSTCSEPCERVEKLLDSPDKGRLRATLRPVDFAETEALLERAQRLNPRDHAILYLYLRGGFTITHIGAALGMHRSSIYRRMRAAAANIAETAQHRG